ncbi:hypothetical protein HYW75_05160 [Candidatus Pacearchaeota archaeon]|nr:hypothetical protein [Candidatus Pacearchaeota archaeon]
MEYTSLLEFERKVVYFSHKISIDDNYASRFTRGVVYGGNCYDISFQMRGKPGTPELNLKKIDLKLIEKIVPLGENQLTEFEKGIELALRTRLRNEIKLNIPLVLLDSL